MTSNIGSQFIQKMQGFGFESREDVHAYDSVKLKVADSVKEFFKPEFINRLDDTIIFDILKKEEIEKIVAMQIVDVEKRLKDKEISLTVSPESIVHIAQKSYDPQYGARPIRRYVQTHILNKIASGLISKTITAGCIVSVSLKKDDLVIDIKKRGRASLDPILTKVNAI